MAPKVSVITPFVAEEDFLAQAIESVRAQAFADWELVLVDDGARDGSRVIAERFATADPSRIRVLDPDPQRRGAAAARNRGIAEARGELIAFLDADDVFRRGKLAAEVAALDAHPEAAMLYARTRYWHDRVHGQDRTERLGVAPNRVHAPPFLLMHVLLQKKGDIPCTCGVLIRRRAILEVGGFEERFALYEDQTLLAKLFFAYPVYVSDACHALYRQHPASTSARAEARGDYHKHRAHPAQDAFFRWLGTYATMKNAADVVQAVYQAKAHSRRVPRGRIRGLIARAVRRFAPF